jgi:hypothetical protein
MKVVEALAEHQEVDKEETASRGPRRTGELTTRHRKLKHTEKVDHDQFLYEGPLKQYFPTFMRLRWGKSFFIRWGPGPNMFAHKYFSSCFNFTP